MTQSKMSWATRLKLQLEDQSEQIVRLERTLVYLLWRQDKEFASLLEALQAPWLVWSDDEPCQCILDSILNELIRGHCGFYFVTTEPDRVCFGHSRIGEDQVYWWIRRDPALAGWSQQRPYWWYAAVNADLHRGDAEWEKKI